MDLDVRPDLLWIGSRLSALLSSSVYWIDTVEGGICLNDDLEF